YRLCAMQSESPVERRRRMSQGLGDPPYTVDQLASLIDDVPDFPKKGILFKDITTLLKEPRAYKQSIDQLSALVSSYKPDKVIGMESRGFIFAAPIAYLLGAGFVPVRKLGKLPGNVI